MSDEITGQGGQATAAPDTQGSPNTQVTQTEPAAGSTQSTEPSESFTDFNNVPEELRPYIEKKYKELQADYTRKTQKLSKAQKEHMQKVQAYDQFMQNPLDNLMRMATQYGMTLTPAQQAAMQHQAQSQKQPVVNENWTPNTWEEVFNKSNEYLQPQLKQVIQEAISPYQQEIAALKQELGIQKAGRIEKQFDSIDPNWRQYEDDMRELLHAHPSLAADPAKLYRLAVPDDVYQSRATQEALKALEAKTQAAKLETSGRSKPSGPAQKQGPMSFQDAFELAKKQLRSK